MTASETSCAEGAGVDEGAEVAEGADDVEVEGRQGGGKQEVDGGDDQLGIGHLAANEASGMDEQVLLGGCA